MYLNKHCHRHSRFKMKPAPAEVSVELKKLLCSALKVSCTDLTSRTFGGLLEVAGVDLSYQDEQCGATPAHWAAWSGQTECVRLLAKTGRVDWNKKNTNRGATPLNDALWHDQASVLHSH